MTLTRTTMLGGGVVALGVLSYAIPGVRKYFAKHSDQAFALGLVVAGALVIGAQETFVSDAQDGAYQLGEAETPPADGSTSA
jgi:hypothetical protein